VQAHRPSTITTARSRERIFFMFYASIKIIDKIKNDKPFQSQMGTLLA